MPYIPEHLRERYKRFLKLIEQTMTLAPGHLNYVISKLCHIYILRKGSGSTIFFSYKVLNEVIGVLESVKQEFYRKVAAPYEDKKKVENGPVSELDK